MKWFQNKKKKLLVKKYGKNEKDTGNAFVQIALLTHDIEKLKPHFQANPKDFHSRRGFLAKITQRKTLLAYLKKNDPETYLKCLEEFKLRK